MICEEATRHWALQRVGCGQWGAVQASRGDPHP